MMMSKRGKSRNTRVKSKIPCKNTNNMCVYYHPICNTKNEIKCIFDKKNEVKKNG